MQIVELGSPTALRCASVAYAPSNLHACFSSNDDESYMTTCSISGKIKEWNNKDPHDRSLKCSLDGQYSEVNSISFSPFDESILISSSDDRVVVLSESIAPVILFRVCHSKISNYVKE